MRRPATLYLTSCQAENSELLGREVAGYVADRLDVATQFVDEIPWRERERLLDEGGIHAGWICGLPYVLKTDRVRPSVELLAAPVMSGARYRHRPVYFSDVVVRSNHPARTFESLRGTRWGYNEPRSHSGHAIVRYHLALRGERSAYFGSIVETGAHQRTLRMIAAGLIDASAVDSTVLETEFRGDAVLRSALRVIETWGPSPAPPWVVSRRLPTALRRSLRSVFLRMDRDAAGRAILRKARMARFGSVVDADYDPIRRMARTGADVTL